MKNFIKKLVRKTKGIVRFNALPSDTKSMIKKVKQEKLTYLSYPKLSMLAKICRSNEINNIAGVILETGCALGGSSILMSSIKNTDREMRIYDVFGMIPPPSEKDGADVHDRYEVIVSGESKGIGGDDYYGYDDKLYEKVHESFKTFGYDPSNNNIQLVKGLIQDTLVVDDYVSLAHIDVDWYEPVIVSLKRITPKLSVGGTIVLDDYLDYSGCHEAVDDFFKDKMNMFSFDTSAGSMVIQKLP